MHTRFSTAAELYLRVRDKEGRLYADDVVAHLPALPNGHPLTDEWRARAASASRLTRYLSRQPKPLHILDLGCGNGWLSNLLAKSGHRVLGVDRNSYELQQAARVFSSTADLRFVEADIFSAPFAFETFDVILLASVIQYFPDLPALLSVLFKYLKPQGEIHIMDSPLYGELELQEAVQRTRHYYANLDFPEMAEDYFHHRRLDLQAYAPKTLYEPHPLRLRIKRRLGQTDSPFPWIMLKKQSAE